MHTMIEDVDLPPVVMPSCAIRRTLAGQKALVTGANSGIGKGVAIALGKAGADVVVTYVARPEQAEEVVAAIRDEGGSAYAHQADVSQEDQVQAMFERMLDQLGTIDILVNNAGLQRDARLEDMSLKDWNTVIGVNLTGQFLCAREAVKEFKRRGVHPEVSCANFGPEQERLNNVFGARLRITASRAGWPGRRAPRIPCAAMPGRFRPILGPAICGTGRSTSRPRPSTASPTIRICVWSPRVRSACRRKASASRPG
jgi:NAD(P)-dependent dehydrogenase (short-subunit alcohol dehydrogenase family)